MALDDISHIDCSSECKNSEDTPQISTKEKNNNSQNDVNPVRRRKIS